MLAIIKYRQEIPRHELTIGISVFNLVFLCNAILVVERIFFSRHTLGF